MTKHEPGPEEKKTKHLPRYTIRSVDPERRGVTGSADNIEDALTGAWALQRQLEAPVEIFDHLGRPPRVVAIVRVDWQD